MARGLLTARPRLALGVALVVAAALAGGSTVALVSASRDARTTDAAAPAAPPSASPPASPTPSATPFVVATTVPPPLPTDAPTPSATPSVVPSATPSVTRSAATVVRYAYPAPTQQYDGLRFTATSQVQGDGTTTVLTIRATDGDGEIAFGGLTWGDGSSVAPEPAPGACPPAPSPTSAPGPYTPRPSSRTLVYRHTYASKAPVTITMTVTSSNASCHPNGPAPERSTKSLDVVFAPDPTATPTP